MLIRQWTGTLLPHVAARGISPKEVVAVTVRQISGPNIRILPWPGLLFPDARFGLRRHHASGGVAGRRHVPVT